MVSYRLEEWVTRPFSSEWTHIDRGHFVEPQLATRAAHDLICYSRYTRTAAIFAIVREGRLDDGTIVQRGPRQIGAPTKFDRAWTHVVASRAHQAPARILFYDSADGSAALFGVDPAGTLQLVSEHTLRPGATHVVSGHYPQGRQFLFYHPEGTGRFLAIPEVPSAFVVLTWPQCCTIVESGNFANTASFGDVDGDFDEVLLYIQESGVAEIHRHIHETIKEVVRHENWRRDWRSIHALPLAHAGVFDALLFDMEGTGSSQVFATDGLGNISPVNFTFGEPWLSKARNWRVILPGTFIGTFPGGTDLCAYDPVAGTISLFGISVFA